jgi:hypothetical protein
MSQLNDDVLLNIFWYLGDNMTLRKIRLVDNHLKNLIEWFCIKWAKMEPLFVDGERFTQLSFVNETISSTFEINKPVFKGFQNKHSIRR